jgi:hypothetical protein
LIVARAFASASRDFDIFARLGLWLMRAGLIALVAIAPAWAQTAATTGTEAQALVVLPPEKQALVREHVKRSDFPAAQLSQPVGIGMVVPPEVDLIVLPDDVGTLVPTTTSYQFLVASDLIAVVEPETRKVIQLIPR